MPHNHSNSYGLKSWEETPIDIVEDDGCSSMPTVEGFYSLRSPDAIKLVSVGEEIYIITANEVSEQEHIMFYSILSLSHLKFCLRSHLCFVGRRC